VSVFLYISGALEVPIAAPFKSTDKFPFDSV